MSFFLGDTRERETASFASGDEFRGVTETLGDYWRKAAAEGERYGTPPSDEELARIESGRARLFTAARRSQELADNWGADRAAIAEAYDNRIETIRRVTGVTLENPERNAYYKEAEADYRLMRERGDISLHDVQNGDTFSARRVDLQRQVFNRKVDELAQSQPDKASSLAFGQSIEEQALAIANAARSELANARRDTGGSFITEIGGTLAGVGSDPANLAALFAGGGLGTARTVIGRVAQVALREGLVNAGVEALQQPQVQDWHRRLGMDYGLTPAAENIGLAFLFGAGIGGGAQGLAEVFGKGLARVTDADRDAMRAVLRGNATSDEVERAAKAIGVDLTDNPDLAIARRFEADDATLPQAPEGVARADHDAALSDAMRAAADPEAPPPVAPLSRERMQGVLRDRPELLPYAEEPPQTVLGLAALRDDVWRAVQAGEIDPVHAAWIGRMAPDAPESHGSLLLALKAAEPATVADARLTLRDAMANIARYREAQATILGAIDDGLDRAARAADPELFAAIDAVESKIAGLRAELARVTEPAAGTAPLAPQLAAREADLAGITGRRRVSPRAQALREEIARLKADQETLARSAREQADATERALRLGISDAAMERARLGPRLRTAMEGVADTPEVVALRERLAGLEIELPARRDPPPLRPAEAVEPGSAEAVRQAEAVLPEIPKPPEPGGDLLDARPQQLSDLLPIAGRADGKDMRAMTLADAVREADRPNRLGDIIANCQL